MSWLETLRTGLEAVRTHRLRSALTVLGILIGIAAVILTVGLGEGAQAQVGSEINALGTNLLTITPASRPPATGFGGASARRRLSPRATPTALVKDGGARHQGRGPDDKLVGVTDRRVEQLDDDRRWHHPLLGHSPRSQL